MKKSLLPIAIASIFLSSCRGNENSATKNNTAENTVETCIYSYDENSEVNVGWTAFKTTDKVGVGGKFDQANVTANAKSTKITEVLQSIKFNIPISSTNTSNEGRDAKIIEHFFGTMANTDIILGQVKSIDGDNSSGKCTFYLTLNDMEKEATLNYIVEDATVKLTGEIDVTNWGATDAVDAINKACEILHTGADGVSKTWPNVELAIEATLKKDCH